MKLASGRAPKRAYSNFKMTSATMRHLWYSMLKNLTIADICCCFNFQMILIQFILPIYYDEAPRATLDAGLCSIWGLFQGSRGMNTVEYRVVHPRHLHRHDSSGFRNIPPNSELIAANIESIFAINIGLWCNLPYECPM